MMPITLRPTYFQSHKPLRQPTFGHGTHPVGSIQSTQRASKTDHHHEEDCDLHTKPGDQYKNWFVRKIINFFGWFKALFKSIVDDIKRKPEEKHEHHDH